MSLVIPVTCANGTPKNGNKDELWFPHHKLIKCGVVYEKHALASQSNVFYNHRGRAMKLYHSSPHQAFTCFAEGTFNQEESLCQLHKMA